MKKITATLTVLGLAFGLTGCIGLSDAPSTRSASLSSNMFAGPGASVANAYNNPHAPGATGHVIVRGDNSTIAGDAAATLMQQTGQL